MQKLMKLVGYRKFSYTFEDGRDFSGWEMFFTAPLTDGEGVDCAGDFVLSGRLQHKDIGFEPPELYADFIVVTDKASGGKLLAAVRQS